MNKQDIILACMASGSQGPLSPVQIQKLLFLVDTNLKEDLQGPHFDFQPYNYGPFDRAVYETLEQLEVDGCVAIATATGKRQYNLTAMGLGRGGAVLAILSPRARNYIKNVHEFVVGLDFATLVKSIYKAYPEMRQNSVFQG